MGVMMREVTTAVPAVLVLLALLILIQWLILRADFRRASRWCLWTALGVLGSAAYLALVVVLLFMSPLASRLQAATFHPLVIGIPWVLIVLAILSPLPVALAQSAFIARNGLPMRIAVPLFFLAYLIAVATLFLLPAMVNELTRSAWLLRSGIAVLVGGALSGIASAAPIYLALKKRDCSSIALP
jgi:hypothetical protein